MALSVGEAAVQGIESGYGLALRGQQAEADKAERARRAAADAADRAEREIDRKDQRVRQATQDQRLAKQDERLAHADARQAALDDMKMADADIAALQSETGAHAANYGGFANIPPEVQQDLTTRIGTAKQRRAQAREQFHRPTIAVQQKDAAEKWARIQAGQLSIDDLSPDDLTSSITAMAKRHAQDFLRSSPDQPSKVEQAGLDLEAGMESGNKDLVLRAANVVFEPELRAGIGSNSHDGSEIVGKSIYDLIPHPQDPNKFVPMLKIDVRRHDGQIGSYIAPVTEDRGSFYGDQKAMPKAISVEDALNRVGQLTTMAAALNQPETRKKIDEGLKGEGGKKANAFMDAVGSIGVTEPKKQVTRERVDLGDRVIEREVDPSGKIISEKGLPKGAPPKEHGAAADKMSPAERELRNGFAAGVISPEEFNKRLRALALGEKGDKGEPLKPAIVKTITEARTNAMAMDRLQSSFKPEYASKGILGFGAEKSLAGKAVLGMDKDSVDWWKNYRKQAELIERHSLFGAALTPTEQDAWRSADIGPGMDSDVIEKNLKTRADLTKQVLDFARQDMIDAGYSEEKINAIANRGAGLMKNTGSVSGDFGAGPPTKPGLDLGGSMTPPKEFRSAARPDPAADFRSAVEAIKRGADKVQIVDRLRNQMGYPPDVVMKLFRDM